MGHQCKDTRFLSRYAGGGTPRKHIRHRACPGHVVLLRPVKCEAFHGTKQNLRGHSTGRWALAMGMVWCLLISDTAAAQPPTQPSEVRTHRQVGVSASVRGTVDLTRHGILAQIAYSGEPIMFGDAITTGPTGHLTIMLLDHTVFMIEPNSTIVIDAFVYDAAADTRETARRTLRGVFRLVTGKMDRKRPDTMELRWPAGLIGIRGAVDEPPVAKESSLSG